MNEVIDAQLSQDSRGVGNCLGLTVFYNCLLQKVGMQAEALFNKVILIDKMGREKNDPFGVDHGSD